MLIYQPPKTQQQTMREQRISKGMRKPKPWKLDKRSSSGGDDLQPGPPSSCLMPLHKQAAGCDRLLYTEVYA